MGKIYKRSRPAVSADQPGPDVLSKDQSRQESLLAEGLALCDGFRHGLIVMEADNDAGAVSSYTQAGAQYGPHLLWVLPLLPVTHFCQEMAGPPGIATGRGHTEMIIDSCQDRVRITPPRDDGRECTGLVFGSFPFDARSQ